MTTAVPEFVKLADALLVDLQAASDAGTFNRAFQSSVLWSNRKLELSELNVLRVDIAPINWDQFVEGRGFFGMTCRYHVGVRKRFDVSEQDPTTGVASDTEVRELIQLLSDLVCYYTPAQPDDEGIRFSSVPEAIWIDETGEATPVRIEWDMLRKEHQFTGYFPLTYQCTRDN